MSQPTDGVPDTEGIHLVGPALQAAPRAGMSARTKARKRALDVLYEADLRQVGARDVLASALSVSDKPVNPYTIELVEGVVDHLDRIDELLEEYAEGWSLGRMAAIDRNLLRIGSWELLWGSVPGAVVVSEAVELAGTLSTEDSPRFVNGVLGRILDVRSTLTL